jgi:3-hydroxyacyl-CoA dehydrogenase
MKIAVVGSGLIGQAWAIVFARGGHNVKMWDGDPKAVTLAFSLIEKQIADLEAAGLITDPKALLSRISSSSTLEDVLTDVDYVQENLPERVDMKVEIFAKMDKPQLFSRVQLLASRRLRLLKRCPGVRVA